MSETVKLSIVAFTKKGCEMAEKYADGAENIMWRKQISPVLYTTKPEYTKACNRSWNLIELGLSSWCKEQFQLAAGILFVGASAIAVRTIAPYLQGKTKDPAVLVADEAGNYLISLLSGHIGGANELTTALSQKIGAQPVITTASDVNQKTAVDVFAVKNNLIIDSMEEARHIAAAILSEKNVSFECDGKVIGNIPKEFQKTDSEYRIVVSPQILKPKGGHTLQLIPKALILGIGCRKGKSLEEIEEKVFERLDIHQYLLSSVGSIVTIDLKKEEKGLIAFAEKYRIPIRFYSSEELKKVSGTFTSSDFVKKTTGVDNVCERAVFCCDPKSVLIQKKTAMDGITIALGKTEWSVKFE